MEITSPNYSYVFNFERNFVPQDARTWMIKNWTISLYFAAIYLVLVFGGQHLMKSRPRFQLRGVLSIWNTMLAVFSIMGACRTLPAFLYGLTKYGWYYSICVPTVIEEDKVSGFWAWMFILSKLPELVDTLFIVLRKQPLIFLHWYHHISVLLFTWFTYAEIGSKGHWFMVMNYCVHAIMYSYYAFRSRGYSPPKFCAMSITILQIAQMIMGSIVSAYAYIVITDNDCNVTRLSIHLALALYFSYFVLFANFFMKSYLVSSAKQKKKLTGEMRTEYLLHKSKVH